MTITTPAGRLFQAMARQCEEETLMDDAIDEIVPMEIKDPKQNGATHYYEDIIYDDYDKSVDFQQMSLDMELSPDQITALFDLGFDRVWIRYVNGTSKLYARDKSNAST